MAAASCEACSSHDHLPGVLFIRAEMLFECAVWATPGDNRLTTCGRNGQHVGLGRGSQGPRFRGLSPSWRLAGDGAPRGRPLPNFLGGGDEGVTAKRRARPNAHAETARAPGWAPGAGHGQQTELDQAPRASCDAGAWGGPDCRRRGPRARQRRGAAGGSQEPADQSGAAGAG
jgi:hypothetical protein